MSTTQFCIKTAKVVPVFKQGNSMLLNNYRPISLLSAFSKILEKAVHKRMLSFVTLNHTLSDCQFGFCPNYSTSATSNCFVNKITNYFSKNNLALTI